MTAEVVSEQAVSTTEQVSTVGVIGGGIMGTGIAEVSARAGCDVVICEVNQAYADSAMGRVRKSLARAENLRPARSAPPRVGGGQVEQLERPRLRVFPPRHVTMARQ